MFNINTYKVFSVLLDYPSFSLKNDISLSFKILEKEGLLSYIHLKKLYNFISYIKNTDLLFLQEKYVSVFDRKKTFSLYLFEHIHGDSRERGMAMIDLKNLYKISNFDIELGGELPDYIPLFLEYLSLLNKNKASKLLGEIIDIISIIGNRLKSCNDLYYILFELLEFLSYIKPNKSLVYKMLNNKEYNKSYNFNLDQEWKEPKVF